MIIEIKRPEVEALIQERLQAGGFSGPEDVILHALRVSENRRTPSFDLLAALRSSPAQDAAQAPEWLRNSWNNARASVLNDMTMDEIYEEIAAARLVRRQPGS